MTSTVTETPGIPLHRLLKRREAEVLLLDYEALLAGGNLALVDADGHLFVGTGAWPESQLADLLAQANQGQMVRSAELLLQPLLVESQLLGAVVAEDPGAEHVLRCLGHSLSLLLLQALETRDVVRETLDRYREINLLYNIGETIGSCLDPEEIPHLMLAEANRIIQAEAGVVLLPSATSAQVDIELELRATSGNAGYAQALSEVWQRIAGQVVRSGRPAIVTNLPDAPASSGSILCAPLKAQEQVLGVVLLGRQAGEPEFTAGDEKLLMALAGQAAIALETARLHQEEIQRERLEEELTIAREIQLSLLPETCPVIPGWEVAAAYRPARTVGGDLYDFLELPGEPRRMGLVIADVTDKGVPAALFMAFSRTIIRTMSMSGRYGSPADVLRRANRLIVRDVQSDSRLLLSAFYATLDIDGGRLTYTNGGHNPPLWLQAATGEVQALPARGIVLGIFEDIQLEEHAIQVAPGDLLVFYTDGVTEARDTGSQFFEEERLRDVVVAHPEASAQQLVEAIIEAVEAFSGEAPQADDITLFVVKRQPA